jgi:hypothetical protein
LLAILALLFVAAIGLPVAATILSGADPPAASLPRTSDAASAAPRHEVLSAPTALASERPPSQTVDAPSPQQVTTAADEGLQPAHTVEVATGQWAYRQAGRPVWLVVPAVGISAAIEGVGLTQEQAMATPSDWANVGWFHLGYVPGQPGTSVISGHLDAPGRRPAVFWSLGQLEPGNQVRVEMDNGFTQLYRVERSESYPYDEAPVDDIFAWSPEPRLALVTCEGAWNRAERNYEERLVVFAQYIGQIDTPADGRAAGRGFADSQ